MCEKCFILLQYHSQRRLDLSHGKLLSDAVPEAVDYKFNSDSTLQRRIQLFFSTHNRQDSHLCPIENGTNAYGLLSVLKRKGSNSFKKENHANMPCVREDSAASQRIFVMIQILKKKMRKTTFVLSLYSQVHKLHSLNLEKCISDTVRIGSDHLSCE